MKELRDNMSRSKGISKRRNFATTWREVEVCQSERTSRQTVEKRRAVEEW